jgi:hypothetical protein
MALVESGVIEYEPFRQALIAEIGAWEQSGRPQEEWSYYRCWAQALEALLLGQSALNPAELDTRVEVLGQRPHGHDHR